MTANIAWDFIVLDIHCLGNIVSNARSPSFKLSRNVTELQSRAYDSPTLTWHHSNAPVALFLAILVVSYLLHEIPSITFLQLHIFNKIVALHIRDIQVGNLNSMISLIRLQLILELEAFGNPAFHVEGSDLEN